MTRDQGLGDFGTLADGYPGTRVSLRGIDDAVVHDSAFLAGQSPATKMEIALSPLLLAMTLTR